MKLKDYLNKYQISGTEFAKKIGVLPSAVSNWITDEDRKPSGENIAVIDEVTGGMVSFRDFYTPKKQKTPTPGAIQS